jgi:hypothetical protein
VVALWRRNPPIRRSTECRRRFESVRPRPTAPAMICLFAHRGIPTKSKRICRCAHRANESRGRRVGLDRSTRRLLSARSGRGRIRGARSRSGPAAREPVQFPGTGPQAHGDADYLPRRDKRALKDTFVATTLVIVRTLESTDRSFPPKPEYRR